MLGGHPLEQRGKRGGREEKRDGRRERGREGERAGKVLLQRSRNDQIRLDGGGGEEGMQRHHERERQREVGGEGRDWSEGGEGWDLREASP